MINGNIIQPTGTLPRNFFQGRIRPTPISNQRVPSNLVDTEQPDCVESEYLNKLGSNIVFVANTDHISHFSCAELGSPMRPASDLSQALSIVQTRYADTTPVTISFSPGNYANTITRTLILPENVVGLVCTQGSAKIRCNLVSKNLEKLDIQNMELLGNLDIIADGNHKGKVSWKNGNLYGTYKYTVKDSAVQSFTMEKVDQLVPDDLDGLYDNEILVTGKGVATIEKVNCVLESKFKGKIDVSETGKLNRYMEKCTVTSGGETTDLSGNGVMDDYLHQSRIYHIETDNGSQKDYWIINMVENSQIYQETKNTTHQGEFSDGSFWYNIHGQNNTLFERVSDSNTHKISGLGGMTSIYGKDQSKIKVRKQNGVIEASTNKRLTPLYVKNLSDSCSLDQKVFNTKITTASHYKETIQNGESELKENINRVDYKIAGEYCTNNDQSKRYRNENYTFVTCDPEIGFHSKNLFIHDSKVEDTTFNETRKLWNNGKDSIFEYHQKDNSLFVATVENGNHTYHLSNRSNNLEKSSRPFVFLETFENFSKNYYTFKGMTSNVFSGPNCNGICKASVGDECKYSLEESGHTQQIILESEDAVNWVTEINNNGSLDFLDNSNIINQTGGQNVISLLMKDDSKYKRNANQFNIKHTTENDTMKKILENMKTIERILYGNASFSSIDTSTQAESIGILHSCTTNDNSQAFNKRINGIYHGQQKLSIRQSNDHSKQELFENGVELNGVLLSNSSNNQTNINFNGSEHNGILDGENANLLIENSKIKGNIGVKKSTVECKNSILKGVLHAIECDSVHSRNSEHLVDGIQCPIILENTKKCDISSSKIESTISTPHIQTKTDKNCKVNLKGVDFTDTTEENSFLACIETEGKGETVCQVGGCSSKRSKFLSAKSVQEGKSKTTFSRNCQFGTDGLDPTVDGEVIETSDSLVVQNGSLTLTPKDDCGSNDEKNTIQIIPRNVSDTPYFTLYYCLGLPQYDYFVSSSISFKDIIDSYQSKEVQSGCFTATSVRCMTDENCVPIDGMYIMINGVRTPNDKNALQTDKEGNIIDRNIKDPLFMEKYHLTKIDPETKLSVAQLGGNLQYTDGIGTGSTTCIPRLIFPIHYASGEWSSLQNGYIEWNYNNSKEMDYKRELRFFIKN